jgi:FixJ family two-component response regulator
MPDIKPLVFIVDDDVSVRESLELLVRHEGWQPETYSTADDFLKRPPALVPSCLILDVSLPGISGLELQSRISEDRLAMPIIFITGHGDIPMTVRAMKAGAVEFLTSRSQTRRSSRQSSKPSSIAAQHWLSNESCSSCRQTTPRYRRANGMSWRSWSPGC